MLHSMAGDFVLGHYAGRGARQVNFLKRFRRIRFRAPSVAVAFHWLTRRASAATSILDSVI